MLFCAYLQKKTLLTPWSQRYSMFSSRSLIVSLFTFQSVTHLELIFLYDLRWGKGLLVSLPHFGIWELSSPTRD